MNQIVYFFLILPFVVIIGGCKKSPVNHTSEMGGSRLWHGMDIQTHSSRPTDTTYISVSFSLIIINDETIATALAGGDTLHKTASNYPNVISFIENVTLPSYSITAYDSIAYNYIDKSMYRYFRYTYFSLTSIKIEQTP